MKQTVYLQFLPEYDAYGISDEKIAELRAQNIIPLIELQPADYQQLAGSRPAPQKPTVAFLLGREKNCYTIDMPYAKAIAQSGVNIRFLTYDDNLAQLNGVDGLILPGGSFNSPNEFYTDPFKTTEDKPGSRSYAYITSIKQAEREEMPILGICAGAQMLGGMHGMKMYRNLKEYTQTSLEHKTKELEAHQVLIYPNTPLANILAAGYIETNSRHKEAMLPNDEISDLKIYAATPDATPEAWGNEEKNILCIQWHPEDFAAQGDEKMQKIYNWLADKALEYKQARPTRQISEKKKFFSR